MPGGLIISQLLARRHNPPMPRILLIDDDEHLGAPLASYFARFGCTLESAVSYTHLTLPTILLV